MKNKEEDKNAVRNLLIEYISFGTQLGLMLFLAVWGGKKLDEKMNLSTHLFVWIFPLLILAATFVKLFRDTAVKKKNKK